MSDQTTTPPTAPVMRDYYVLLMTATQLTVRAESEDAALVFATQQAGRTVDPQELQWVPKYVSDRPFEIAGPEEVAPDEGGAPIPAVEPATPKIEIIR